MDFYLKFCSINLQNSSRLLIWEQKLVLNRENAENIWTDGENVINKQILMNYFDELLKKIE